MKPRYYYNQPLKTKKTYQDKILMTRKKNSNHTVSYFRGIIPSLRDASFLEIVSFVIPIILQFIQIIESFILGWYVKEILQTKFSELRFMASNRINNYMNESFFFMH